MPRAAAASSALPVPGRPLISADTDTDLTRHRVADHLLGPPADLLDLGADAATAVATMSATAFTAVLVTPVRSRPARSCETGVDRLDTTGTPTREPIR